jgi:hypothetical protein
LNFLIFLVYIVDYGSRSKASLYRHKSQKTKNMGIEIQNVFSTCLAAKPLLPSKSRDQSMDIKPTIGCHPVLQGGEDTNTPNSWVQYRHPTNSGALRNVSGKDAHAMMTPTTITM